MKTIFKSIQNNLNKKLNNSYKDSWFWSTNNTASNSQNAIWYKTKNNGSMHLANFHATHKMRSSKMLLDFLYKNKVSVKFSSFRWTVPTIISSEELSKSPWWNLIPDTKFADTIIISIGSTNNKVIHCVRDSSVVILIIHANSSQQDFWINH